MLITTSGAFDNGNTLLETIHLKLGQGRGDLVGAPAASIAPHVEATPVGQGCGRQGCFDLVLKEKECWVHWSWRCAEGASQKFKGFE